jgi:uncharacterized membrane protein YeiH
LKANLLKHFQVGIDLGRLVQAQGVSAAVGGGLLVDLIAGRTVEVVHRGPWNATAALAGASLYAATAALGAPTRVSQAIAFTVVVGMRMASLHWRECVAAAGGYATKGR